LQEQLKIVDTTISQKERLLSILAEFQNRGVDIERLGRELDKGQNQNPDLKQTPGQVNNNGFSKDLELINRVIELTS
jgi:hypothetical protein